MRCQYIIIIIHEFHRDARLETKLQGRYNQVISIINVFNGIFVNISLTNAF